MRDWTVGRHRAVSGAGLEVQRLHGRTAVPSRLRRQSGFTLLYGYEGSNRSNHHMLNSSTCHLTAPLSRTAEVCLPLPSRC